MLEEGNFLSDFPGKWRCAFPHIPDLKSELLQLPRHPFSTSQVLVAQVMASFLLFFLQRSEKPHKFKISIMSSPTWPWWLWKHKMIPLSAFHISPFGKSKRDSIGRNMWWKKLEWKLKPPETPDAKRTNLVNDLTFKYIVCFLAKKIAAGKQAT